MFTPYLLPIIRFCIVPTTISKKYRTVFYQCLSFLDNIIQLSASFNKSLYRCHTRLKEYIKRFPLLAFLSIVFLISFTMALFLLSLPVAELCQKIAQFVLDRISHLLRNVFVAFLRQPDCFGDSVEILDRRVRAIAVNHRCVFAAGAVAVV